MRRRLFILLVAVPTVVAVFERPAGITTVSAKSVSVLRSSSVEHSPSAAKKKCITKKVHGKKKKVCATAPKVDVSGLHAAWAYFDDTKTLDVRISDAGNPNPSGLVGLHDNARPAAPAAPAKPLSFTLVRITSPGYNFAGAALDNPADGTIKSTSNGIDLVGPFTPPFEVGLHIDLATAPPSNPGFQFETKAKVLNKGI